MSTSTKRKAKPKTKVHHAVKARAPRKHVTPHKKHEALPTPTPVKAQPVPERSYVLAIRLKGEFGTPWPVANTLKTLRMKRKFNAVLLESNPSTIGLLRAVKDYVTWGDVKTDDITTIIRERGEFSDGLVLNDETIRDRLGESSSEALASALTQGRITLQGLWKKGLSPVFRLHPPSGGFEGTIKRPHGSGGELGKRKTSLSTLLARMV